MFRNINRGWIAVCTAVVGISVVLSAQQGPPQGRGQATIHLKATEFAPGRGELPQIPPGLSIAG